MQISYYTQKDGGKIEVDGYDSFNRADCRVMVDSYEYVVECNGAVIERGAGFEHREARSIASARAYVYVDAEPADHVRLWKMAA